MVIKNGFMYVNLTIKSDTHVAFSSWSPLTF